MAKSISRYIRNFSDKRFDGLVSETFINSCCAVINEKKGMAYSPIVSGLENIGGVILDGEYFYPVEMYDLEQLKRRIESHLKRLEGVRKVPLIKGKLIKEENTSLIADFLSELDFIINEAAANSSMSEESIHRVREKNAVFENEGFPPFVNTLWDCHEKYVCIGSYDFVEDPDGFKSKNPISELFTSYMGYLTYFPYYSFRKEQDQILNMVVRSPKTVAWTLNVFENQLLWLMSIIWNKNNEYNYCSYIFESLCEIEEIKGDLDKPVTSKHLKLLYARLTELVESDIPDRFLNDIKEVFSNPVKHYGLNSNTLDGVFSCLKTCIFVSMWVNLYWRDRKYPDEGDVMSLLTGGFDNSEILVRIFEEKDNCIESNGVEFIQHVVRYLGRGNNGKKNHAKEWFPSIEARVCEEQYFGYAGLELQNSDRVIDIHNSGYDALVELAGLERPGIYTAPFQTLYNLCAAEKSTHESVSSEEVKRYGDSSAKTEKREASVTRVSNNTYYDPTIKLGNNTVIDTEGVVTTEVTDGLSFDSKGRTSVKVGDITMRSDGATEVDFMGIKLKSEAKKKQPLFDLSDKKKDSLW